jgi:ABC-type nickel/cobalt efflux system permease component RcnA
MTRVLLAVLAALLLLPAAAPAHPLGNFSVNRLDVVAVSTDRVEVRHVLDQAEVPTFRERGTPPAEVLAAKRRAAEEGLRLTVDGRAVPLRADGPGRITFPAGQGGLRTTRVELTFTAPVQDTRRVTLTDATYEDRVGWKAIVVRPGEGTAVRSDVPATDPTNGLRDYPRDRLESPPDVGAATLAVSPGDGTVDAPGADATGGGGGGDGFAGLIDDAAAGEGLIIGFLLAAFAWGALHALSPGHGKAMVAAYLVGTRGRPRDAVLLGATVTVTHTAGVFALGFVALGLAGSVLPEDLYPWLELVAGALVLGVGIGVLRSRARERHDHHHHHHAGAGHHHDHGPHERRNILALGASAGLIPCPSALVVLLGAVAQHEIVLGLVLIVAFSLGLAATLTGIGLAVVLARTRLQRIEPGARLRRIATAIPVASALVIVVLGTALTAQAVPGVVG